MTEDGSTKSPLDRFLSIFADVRPGEGPRVLALTVNIFLLLFSYYFLKVIREPLVLNGQGFLGLKEADLKNAGAAGQAIALLFVVPLYSALARRVDRIKLINICTAIFLACIIAFFILVQGGADVGFAFFIWVGIFNVFVIAQFWSFANDLYTNDAGKRLFAIVAFGQALGSIVGAYVAGKLQKEIGLPPLLPIAAGLLFAGAVISNLIDRHADKSGDHADETATTSQPAAASTSAKPHKESVLGGFALVFANRYLLVLAFIMFIYNMVNTNGEWILSHLLVQHVKETAAAGLSDAALKAATEQAEGAFYANYFTWTNAVGAIFQLLFVSRVVKYFGLKVAILVMPTISLLGYGVVIVLPVLSLVKSIKIAENAADYSIQNTAKQSLWLPTTRAEKYQAKAAVDTFFVRFGDVFSFVVIQLCTKLLGFDVKAVAVVNVAFVVIWWILSQRIGKQNEKLTTQQRG